MSPASLIQLERSRLALQVIEEPVSLLQPGELVVDETPVKGVSKWWVLGFVNSPPEARGHQDKHAT